MRTIKNILSQFHRWLFWMLISFIFWGWIFTLVTDAAPARKVTLYAQVEACQDQALAQRLEQGMPQGLKMVKVHPFSYAVFDTKDLQNADLFILRASEIADCPLTFAPLDGEDWDSGDWELYRGEDGKCYGVKIYDAAAGKGAAREYLDYTPDVDCYLCFNATSPHLGGGDGAALRIAEALLRIK